MCDAGYVYEPNVNVVVGDFNGDGRSDLAVSTWDGLFILPNEGGGNFGWPIQAVGLVPDDELGLVPVSLLFAGDFNGDGTFLPGRPIIDLAQRSSWVAWAAGDFNRDGKVDLVVSDANGTRILAGNGDGTFRPGATITSLNVHQLVVADFNHDGRSDVGVVLSNGFLVFLQRGDGTFGPEIPTRFDGSFFDVYAVADFNGDGLPDLASVEGIALGKDDGGFQPPIRYPSLGGRPVVGVGGSSVAFADIKGDGKPDPVVAHRSTTSTDLVVALANSISIYPGKGDGTFLPPTGQPVGWGPSATVALDVDGDGRLDLAIVNFGSNTVSVLLARAQDGPALRRAFSAASDIAIVAPESLASLFAPTTATASASPPWPTSLGGISLEVRDSAGAARLARLLFVSPSQINFQVPADTALGEATLAVVAESGSTPIGSMQVDSLALGLFMMSPAVVPVPVLYAGPQGIPGLDQINVRLLPEVLQGPNLWWFPNGELASGLAVTIRINGVVANYAEIR